MARSPIKRVSSFVARAISHACCSLDNWGNPELGGMPKRAEASCPASSNEIEQAPKILPDIGMSSR